MLFSKMIKARHFSVMTYRYGNEVKFTLFWGLKPKLSVAFYTK
jgi:hypothetical protein